MNALDGRQIYVSKDVLFNEFRFPFSSTEVASSMPTFFAENSPPLASLQIPLCSIKTAPASTSSTSRLASSPAPHSSRSSPAAVSSTSQATQPAPSTSPQHTQTATAQESTAAQTHPPSVHPMQTRSKSRF